MWKEGNGDFPLREGQQDEDNDDNEDLSSDSGQHITAMSQGNLHQNLQLGSHIENKAVSIASGNGHVRYSMLNNPQMSMSEEGLYSSSVY